MSRLRRTAKRLMLLGGAALFLAVVAEAVLSLFLPAPPVDRAPLVQVAPHPVLGYALVPNQSTFSYQAVVETDDHGLRRMPTSTSTRTVVFVGGSEVFGKGVTAAETFVARFGSARGMRCVNAGVPDYNIDQGVLWLERYGAAHRPEVVVLTFYWNDLFYEPLNRQNTDVGEWAPRRILKKRGLLDRIAPLYTRSRLLYEVRNRLKTVVGRYRGHPEQKWRDALLANETFPEMEAAWRRVDGELKRFARLSHERGFRALVVVLPIEHGIERGRPSGVVERVTKLAEAHGLVVFDATSALQTSQEAGERPFIPWDGRPAPAGHRRIADVLIGHQQTPR